MYYPDQSFQNLPHLALQKVIPTSKQFSHELYLIKNKLPKDQINSYSTTSIPSSKNTCIVYLHGLTSYAVQGKFLLPYLGKSYDLCLFDSRAHGKNKCEDVTFGLKQSRDLYEVLTVLQEKNYSDFILWGRSMGAVTSLLLLKNIQDMSTQSRINIKYVIIDSPFVSFQQIALELIIKKTLLPEFIAKIALSKLLQVFQVNHQLNMKQINVSNCCNVKTPAIFLFSDNDELIDSKKHGSMIFQNYGGPKQIVKLTSKHNELRPQSIINQVLKRIQQKPLNIAMKASTVLNYSPKMKKGLFLYKQNLSTKKKPLVNISHDAHQIQRLNRSIIMKPSYNSYTNIKIQQQSRQPVKLHPKKKSESRLNNQIYL